MENVIFTDVRLNTFWRELAKTMNTYLGSMPVSAREDMTVELAELVHELDPAVSQETFYSAVLDGLVD